MQAGVTAHRVRAKKATLLDNRFDGDSINFTLPLDMNTTDALRPLAGHMSTFDLNAPRKVSRNLAMPKPAIATIASWMHFNEPLYDPAKAERMSKIPVLSRH